MFAYCGNNPVIRVDYAGQSWSEILGFLKTVFIETGNAMEFMSPAYTACGGVAAGDGLLPVGDAIGLAGATLITLGSIGYGIYQTVKAPATSIPKTEVKAETVAIPTESDNSVVFPANPLEFAPLGLVSVSRSGTKNGGFIHWMDPITNTAVFRWDENINYENGPHYHIIGDANHYYAGDLVPEPYASRYFPFN